MSLDRTLTVSTADGPMNAFVASPEGAGPFPAMLVLQEAFGVNDHIQDVCRRLAAEGYVALAPELFHRAGSGVLIPYGDMSKVMPQLAALRNEGIATDARAALLFLRALPEVDAARVGAIGFCMGGFAAYLTACRTDVATTIAFYGGGIVRERPNIGLRPVIGETEDIHGPILLFFGGQDQGIPMSDVDAIRARLIEAKREHEIVVYPEAGHAFFCDQRSAYHAESAEDAWRRSLEWLDRHLGRAGLGGVTMRP